MPYIKTTPCSIHTRKSGVGACVVAIQCASSWRRAAFYRNRRSDARWALTEVSGETLLAIKVNCDHFAQ
jgi:hypothetical protein